MARIDPRLEKLLDEHQVDYEVLHHREDFRACTAAEDTHTPPEEFAKTVLVRVDDGYALAVLPATHYVAPSLLAKAIGAREVTVASESEMQELMTGCEVGAASPFGSFYDLPVYASPVLARDERITFNAGTHRDAVRMAWADYERLAEPKVVHLSRHEEKRL
jgi:Ala-tRNA(Pro) deacylase